MNQMNNIFQRHFLWYKNEYKEYSSKFPIVAYKLNIYTDSTPNVNNCTNANIQITLSIIPRQIDLRLYVQ